MEHAGRAQRRQQDPRGHLGRALIGGEEVVSFLLALIGAPAGSAVGTLGAGLRIARSGRGWEIGSSLAIAGGAMALFVLYGIFALIVSTIEGGTPSYQRSVEEFVLLVPFIGLAGGALSALFCALVPSRQTLA